MTELKCLRCEYIWEARTEEPKVCPRCKNRLDTEPRRIGLQIGGELNPNDQVGMYVPMPERPGVGVKVNINDITPDTEVRKIIEHTNNPKIQELGKEILKEKNPDKKLHMVSTLITLAANITTCVVNVRNLEAWVRGMCGM